MPTCVVIQPFDGGKFDKRFRDTYKKALEEAGLDVYRADQDLGADVPIETIEKRIRDASICFADITTDNPNVWYELGYAFAKGRSTIMVCSTERKGSLPFDIQHRSVIKYEHESPSDFEDLRKKITERAKRLLDDGRVKQSATMEQAAREKELSRIEIRMLKAIAGATVPDGTASGGTVPGATTSVDFLKKRVRNNLKELEFSLALHELQKRDFVKCGSDENNFGEPFPTVTLTESGWNWISENESLFSTHEAKSDPEEIDDDIPF